MALPNCKHVFLPVLNILLCHCSQPSSVVGILSDIKNVLSVTKGEIFKTRRFAGVQALTVAIRFVRNINDAVMYTFWRPRSVHCQTPRQGRTQYLSPDINDAGTWTRKVRPLQMQHSSCQGHGSH